MGIDKVTSILAGITGEASGQRTSTGQAAVVQRQESQKSDDAVAVRISAGASEAASQSDAHAEKLKRLTNEVRSGDYTKNMDTKQVATAVIKELMM